ncbi:MAG: phytanoyl-CoA dioxygenase family protein [Prosthecobacter sp.]|nr:phytanoyl-CoA dioxygenase family protein [Prosthecobacter sp.]
MVVSMGSMSSAGRRGVLAVPEIAKLARSERILALLRPYLPQEPVPVRGIYFDKSPDANWLVSWHQDLTITVHERVDSAGFGPWSVKDGVTHVQPPAELLAKMLTVRIHLDDADASNGALRVLRGSHRHGRLSAGQIQDMRSKCAEVLCAAKAGDALLIKPMILHASGRSSSEQHRRILHIEYAGFNLPDGMRWCDE